MSTTQEMPVNSTVKVIDTQKPEFDQIFSGKPCMNSNLEFNVVSIGDGTLTVESELSGTFDSKHINDAHKFNARADLFELVNG